MGSHAEIFNDSIVHSSGACQTNIKRSPLFPSIAKKKLVELIAVRSQNNRDSSSYRTHSVHGTSVKFSAHVERQKVFSLISTFALFCRLSSTQKDRSWQLPFHWDGGKLECSKGRRKRNGRRGLPATLPAQQWRRKVENSMVEAGATTVAVHFTCSRHKLGR